MRDKNEDIHVFIIEEDRKKNRELALREQTLREKLQQPSEELIKLLKETSAVPEEPVKKETASSGEGDQSASVKSESDIPVNMDSCWMKPDEVGSLGFQIDMRALATSTVVYAFALISAIVILWLNVVVTRDFPVYGLRFSLEWATPYRIMIGAALGMLGLTAVAELFQIYVLARKRRDKGVDDEWKIYALPDGSAIRVKTLVREVKRLNQYGHGDKPIYVVKADNMVQVLDNPESL